MSKKIRVLFFYVVALFSVPARADLYEKLLDDVFPMSFARNSLTGSNFEIRGQDGLPTDAKLVFENESVQWVRIDDRLVIPRVRLRIEIPAVDGAEARVRGRSTPFRETTQGVFSGEILIPLVSGRASEFSLTWSISGKSVAKTLFLERKNEKEDRFFFDSSCSSALVDIQRIAAEKLAASSGDWVSFDCRWIMEKREAGNVPSLDLIVFWDGQDGSLKMNGVETQSVEPSVFRFRLRPPTRPLAIETTAGERFQLSYRIPPEMNLGFVGIGMGPYRYRLLGGGADISTNAPILTVYGSYQLGETVRLTAFNATTLHDNFFTDSGLYVKTDSFRFFDQRIGVYLMFGANFVGIKFPSGTRFKGGAPQGFEAVARDFLRKNRTATFGAFIYPPIDGKSYYNVWLRYGSSSFFGEVNFLSIRDRFDDVSVYSRSAGVSIGFPLFRLF